ncbi:MAG: glycosyltransferase family 39 protein [Prolixibacteraceae bacterium]|nr:glycosyltransferase family 39 protein [Prolixibacteraceae bacterium]
MLILILLYPVLFIFQGGDLTDAGSHATTYQNFFKNLQLGEVRSLRFLSDLTGALWFKFFPNSGIIGLKLLYLIFFYPVVFITYFLLKGVAKNRLFLLTGVFCGVVFATRSINFVFNKDIASWFFLILTGFFILNGLNTGKLKSFYFSGILFVFACLSRFPDIVLILLLPFLLILCKMHHCKTISLKCLWQAIKQYLIFIAGMLTILIIIQFVFKYFNIYDTYIKNLDVVQESANSNNVSSYSMINLIKSYLREGIIFLPYLLSVTSLILTTSLIYEYSKIKKKYLPFVIFIFSIFFTALFVFRNFSYSGNIKYLVPAFCAFPLLMSLINKDRFSKIVAVFCVIGLTQALGSNTGLFLKLSRGFIVLIPLSLLILSEKKQIKFENIRILTKPVLITGISFILFFSLVARLGWIYHVDSGLTCRFRCIYSIEHQKMKGILTTKENAQHIKQLCIAINLNINEGKNLFIYGHQPMFYYLTESFPPVKEFWLENNTVQVDELFFSLEESIASTGNYPLIVDTKQNILGDKGQVRLEQFLNKYGYRCKLEHSDFNIWDHR